MQNPKEIQDFILDNVLSHPKDLVTFTAGHYRVSRQAIHRHVQALIEDGLLTKPGSTRGAYALKRTIERCERHPISGLREDVVWRERFLPLVADLAETVRAILQYGFSEMLNNAIDHSGSDMVDVALYGTARTIDMTVRDFGIGIFAKIKDAYGLDDERHAVLELSKGKLTTDPKRHSGEGIFFTSRMFDRFTLRAGRFLFGHGPGGIDLLLDDGADPWVGTLAGMQLNLATTRTVRQIFDAYAPEHEDRGFSRTVLAIALGRYEGEQLISRSQAKRLLARLERFREVALDFLDVDVIGQPFADEMFRVFPQEHPTVRLTPINASPAVERMIRHVTAAEV